jgi:Glycosyl hydrolase family 1
MQLKTLLSLALAAQGLQSGSAASLAELSSDRLVERQAASNTTDQAAVQQRVADLWAQVEQDKPIQAPAIQQVITNFTQADYDPGESINQTPYQATYRDSKAAELRFPAGFEYGVAAAAPQIEGAVKADGRGPSIWDFFGHRTNGMRNNGGRR